MPSKQDIVDRKMRELYNELLKLGFTDHEIMTMIFEWWDNE